MNPPASTVELTGSELKRMLEENLEHTFSRDPWKQMGGYVKRSLGISVFFKIENPLQTRIQKLFVGKEEVHPEKIYQAAFITEQGVPAKYGQNRKNHPERIIDLICEYTRKNKAIELGTLGTFTPV